MPELNNALQTEASTRRHLICAVITPNYLPQFLVLGESVAEKMPSADLRVLILQDCADVDSIQDRIDEYVARAGIEASHRALTIDECDWDDFDVESAAVFYNILEFATSVKPALMRFFLRQGWERVTYLDPDIQVFGDFTPLLDDDADLSLTPHFLSDIPKDDHRPSTNDVLLAGFFNLGFCSVRPSAMAFLNWWSARLQFECLNDHLGGFFTDQKIVDMATLKSNVQVIVDPGCNVAYWNLHERRVVRDADGWAVQVGVERRALYFFHFSGFRVDHSPSLSIHSSRKVLGDAVPRAFALQYEARLESGVPDEPPEFTLGGTSLAEAIPAFWRDSIREDSDVHVRAGLSLRAVRDEVYPPLDASPWSACLTCGTEHDNFGTRARSFLVGWACYPSIVGVPNAISAFFRKGRLEFGVPAMEQLSWAAQRFSDSIPGNEELVDEVMRAAAEAVRRAVPLTLVGYFSYPAGIGQIARRALRTLEAHDIHPAIDRVYAVSDSYEYLSALLRRRNPLGAANASVLCFVNADQWQVHVVEPRRFNAPTQHVEAVWAWELEDIPLHMYNVVANGEVSRIHALSKWSARAMAKVLPVPVQRLAPFSVDLFDRDGARPTGVPRVPAPYLLTTIDAKSYLSRKNPEAVLHLWNRVLDDYPDHWLVVKSADLRDFADPELLDLIDSTSRTLLIDEYLDDDEYLELLAHCSTFVSLHRSEGMGLTPLEAGLCGLPVVYTNYGGVAEFMEEGFFPVDYTMVRVGESHYDTGPYDRDSWWAEPDLDDAERQLRRALELGDEDETVATLAVNRKQLVENLESAQAEVVATAERLLERARSDEQIEESPLIAELLRPRVVVEEVVPLPRPNPVLYPLVAVAWVLYQRFPKRLRFQFNIALMKLRRRGEPE